MTLTTDKGEAIYAVLVPIYQIATEKWTKCQWSHPVGKLGLINLKGDSVADIQGMVDGAGKRVEHLLSLLSEKYSYKTVLALAEAAEWQEYGDQCQDYCRLVEWQAQEAERIASELLEEIKDGDIRRANVLAGTLRQLESIRESGKKVWEPLAKAVSQLALAVKTGWEPRMIIGGSFIVGDSEVVSRDEQQLFSPQEWIAEDAGIKRGPLEWKINNEGDVLHWGERIDKDAIGLEAI